MVADSHDAMNLLTGAGDDMKAFFQTDDTWTGLDSCGITLGLVMFPHGAQKLLGWYGGFGFSGTMGFFTETMHLPWIVALLVIVGESSAVWG